MKKLPKSFTARKNACYGQSTRSIIMEKLKKGACSRADLRDAVLAYGKSPNTFTRTLFEMTKNNELKFEGSSHSPNQIISLVK